MAGTPKAKTAGWSKFNERKSTIFKEDFPAAAKSQQKISKAMNSKTSMPPSYKDSKLFSTNRLNTLTSLTSTLSVQKAKMKELPRRYDNLFRTRSTEAKSAHQALSKIVFSKAYEIKKNEQKCETEEREKSDSCQSLSKRNHKSKISNLVFSSSLFPVKKSAAVGVALNHSVLENSKKLNTHRKANSSSPGKGKKKLDFGDMNRKKSAAFLSKPKNQILMKTDCRLSTQENKDIAIERIEELADKKKAGEKEQINDFKSLTQPESPFSRRKITNDKSKTKKAPLDLSVPQQRVGNSRRSSKQHIPLKKEVASLKSSHVSPVSFQEKKKMQFSASYNGSYNKVVIPPRQKSASSKKSTNRENCDKVDKSQNKEKGEEKSAKPHEMEETNKIKPPKVKDLPLVRRFLPVTRQFMSPKSIPPPLSGGKNLNIIDIYNTSLLPKKERKSGFVELANEIALDLSGEIHLFNQWCTQAFDIVSNNIQTRIKGGMLREMFNFFNSKTEEEITKAPPIPETIPKIQDLHKFFMEVKLMKPDGTFIKEDEVQEKNESLATPKLKPNPYVIIKITPLISTAKNQSLLPLTYEPPQQKCCLLPQPENLFSLASCKSIPQVLFPCLGAYFRKREEKMRKDTEYENHLNFALQKMQNENISPPYQLSTADYSRLMWGAATNNSGGAVGIYYNHRGIPQRALHRDKFISTSDFPHVNYIKPERAENSIYSERKEKSEENNGWFASLPLKKCNSSVLPHKPKEDNNTPLPKMKCKEDSENFLEAKDNDNSFTVLHNNISEAYEKNSKKKKKYFTSAITRISKKEKSFLETNRNEENIFKKSIKKISSLSTKISKEFMKIGNNKTTIFSGDRTNINKIKTENYSKRFSYNFRKNNY